MPSYALVTFGCQMNQHDSERIGEVLRGAGYDEVERPDQADLVLLNTCSVREKAEQKLRSEVGRLGMLKQQKKDLLIAVAGCVAQQEGEKLIKRLPQIDLVLGPDNIPELPTLLAELELGGPSLVRTVFDVDEPRFLSARAEPGRTASTAYVTVMKGCDERCTYCVVPYTRGPERYRPAREILDEVERLVQAGVREVTLLGQTVNSYRDPSGSLSAAPVAAGYQEPGRPAWASDSEFPALLRLLSGVAGLLRLRYTSPHPRHLTGALIRAHQELPVLARHVHMPFQSGSDRLLKRMLRRYTAAEYVERVDALRKAVQGLTLSSDVIVGFPGETRDDFERTLELVERVRFTGVYGFMYSERPHTPARNLADDVPEIEKRARLEELFELADGHRRAHLETLVGGAERVLAEQPGARGGFSGRTERNEIVHFSCAGDPIGQIVPVQITRAFKNSLEGAADPNWIARAGREPLPRAASAPRRALPVLTGP
ncbi:MAG TPA: tRNA (N6-isopentenyl adenosine(37)-C2)-methylthiotransferase MiaB [Polyangiaceae bacterium]|jgi:tRNA-2-methylthio-N6-dimethylallyladenosine synthase